MYGLPIIGYMVETLVDLFTLPRKFRLIEEGNSRLLALSDDLRRRQTEDIRALYDDLRRRQTEDIRALSDDLRRRQTEDIRRLQAEVQDMMKGMDRELLEIDERMDAIETEMADYCAANIIEEPTRGAMATADALSNRAFIASLYRSVLTRPPSREDLKAWKNALASGASRQQVVRAIVNSPEFLNMYMTRGKPSLFWDSLHAVRVEMMRKLLPAAEHVLDLGGAGSQEGSLLKAGYPHRPKTVSIIDLPPTDRLLKAEETETEFMHNGTSVRYYYRSMTDLSCFESDSFDFVWSGQSIEHIGMTEAADMVGQIFRVLKPGGRFALDTPNRKATVHQVPSRDMLAHPEHQHEYVLDELIDLIKKGGFVIEGTRGLVDLSNSIKNGVFDFDEFYCNLDMNGKPDSSYLFYISAVKPQCGV
jgi:ubiquinone/menaquinone biosynthesis C-methylase UbiE